ncbi:MAG: hypothetical protein V3T35_07640 [Spirochaetia bacterium]
MRFRTWPVSLELPALVSPSRYLVAFTGAGISTERGIPRCGMLKETKATGLWRASTRPAASRRSSHRI